ncbi:MAG: hypothetical protein SCM96_05405 [Acidobacteriota bacterium]|nr:hypothetical protein [Acidobacteriota bacterium]
MNKRKTRGAATAFAAAFILFAIFPFGSESSAPKPAGGAAVSGPNGETGGELPVPSFANALIVSMEHSLADTAEVEYIKKNFPWGLYAWLSFSRTALFLNLDWSADPAEADAGIARFKKEVDDLIAQARKAGVHLHIVVCSGLARGLHVYRAAKEEDVRNAQWYNDNNLASDEQIRNPNVLDQFVFGTLSRYALKVRRNLEAKGRAGFAHLKRRMDENPDMVILVSGWGEVEMNFHRLNPAQFPQERLCDYSPFAVLEFRDWIRHEGLYAPGGPFAGQGFRDGGGKYRNAMGLKAFNRDYGTAFETWNLRYFHWDLDEARSEDDRREKSTGRAGRGGRPADESVSPGMRPDARRIPFVAYNHNGMMPAAGSAHIPGGFDPPRNMKPGDAFWELWNLFRETLVHHFVLDAARWASESGIPADRWYSHQLPGDYLFNTFPGTERKPARSYSSASPLWTADIKPYGKMGATIYDIKFPNFFARTTRHALQAISDMSPDWALLEYDAETYPPGFDVQESSVEDILAQYLRVYEYRPRIINFWRWQDPTKEHRIKGMNKEKALRMFVAVVRDKARKTDLDVVFDPPQVFGVTARRTQEAKGVRLTWSKKIWEGHDWEWKDWGDFSHFEILRGRERDFSSGAGIVIGKSRDPAFEDVSAEAARSDFRIRAVNVRGVAGPFSKAVGASMGSHVKKPKGS